jgi:hypothetical protein
VKLHYLATQKNGARLIIWFGTVRYMKEMQQFIRISHEYRNPRGSRWSPRRNEACHKVSRFVFCAMLTSSRALCASCFASKFTIIRYSSDAWSLGGARCRCACVRAYVCMCVRLFASAGVFFQRDSRLSGMMSTNIYTEHSTLSGFIKHAGFH